MPRHLCLSFFVLPLRKEMLRWLPETVKTPFGVDVDVLTWAVDVDDSHADDDPLPELDGAEDHLGSVMWNSNSVVLDHLTGTVFENRSAKGLGIIELGAGVGVLGIALAAGGANVLITDLKELVPLMALNIHRNRKGRLANGGSVVAATWKWGERIPPAALKLFGSQSSAVHFVLLCDALYGNPRDWPQLIQTLNSIVDQFGSQIRVVNFCEQRVESVEDAFMALIQKDDERWVASKTSEIQESSSLGMTVRVTTLQRNNEARKSQQKKRAREE